MDYPRIYEDFIADRRSRPEPDRAVSDRHHVAPRFLGGGDEPENLIRLTHADHLFAHVLLARIHGGTLAQVAVRMSGMRKYNGGRPSRERYAFLRVLLRPQQAERASALWDDPERAERMGAHKRGNKYRAGKVPNVTDAMRERLGVSMRGNSNAAGCRRSPETVERMRQNALAQHARRRAEGRRTL